MNPQHQSSPGWFILAAVIVPLILVFTFAPLQGQIRLPGEDSEPRSPHGFDRTPRGRDPFGTPRGFDPLPRGRDPFETPRGGGFTTYEWSCSRCNGHLGTGLIEPTMSKCPHCGASFTGVQGGFRSSPLAPRATANSLFTGVSTVLVILVGGLLLIGAAVGIVLLVVFANKNHKPKMKKRRRRPYREGTFPEARPV